MTSDLKISGPNRKKTAANKLRLLAGGSIGAAAMLLASAPQPANAQANLAGTGIRNFPISQTATLNRPEPLPNPPTISAPGSIPTQVNSDLTQFAVKSANVRPLTTPSQAISNTQSFQATTTFAGYTPGPTVDEVNLSSSETVINWTTLDTLTIDDTSAAIDILPTGRTINFRTTGGLTVLNRILPTANAGGIFRAIEFNGTVNALDNGLPGGNVWFYSPGGIVVGNGAAFNVGGLILTSNDIDTTGGLTGSGGNIRFRGTAGSQSAVEIAPTATINASNYVALVAPRILQQGSVTSNGSVAYVAAEQADLTISSGLFDIAVTVGTENTTGIEHTGSTGGSSSTGLADPKAIYMVAVPKNDALTMLIGGNIGYQPASAAGIVNGNVVLTT
ncbi:hypothetical protein MNBD_ALPHA04-1538, partial [hydrothermal vent metagenome]